MGQCPPSVHYLGLDAQEGAEAVAAPLDLRDARVLWREQLRPLAARQVRLYVNPRQYPSCGHAQHSSALTTQPHTCDTPSTGPCSNSICRSGKAG